MSTSYHSLASGPLTQNWSDAALIATDDLWDAVPSIVGYRGDGLAATGADPQTILADGASTPVDVNANETNPNTFTTGGIAEFDTIADPTVALQGSGTADAPHLVLHLDATGRENVRIQFNARDIDGAADNSVQQIAVQYRIGETGDWTNLPTGYIADATTGPSLATLVTAVDVTLPDAADNQAQVQVRIVTADAAGSDEWIGIDDIAVSSDPAGGGGPDTTPPSLVSSNPADDAINVAPGADIVLTFDEAVRAGTGDITVTDGAGDVRTITLGAADPDGSVTVNGNAVTIDLAADLALNTHYDVIVAPGAIEDTSGNDFAGVALDALDFNTIAGITAISAIQGNGVASPIVGGTVLIEAIVVGDFQDGDADGARNLTGFYLQEEASDWDADPLSSEGIFVFQGLTDVQLGDRVQVIGTVSEFFGFTEITATSVTVVEAGAVADVNTMAATIDLPAAGVSLSQNGAYQPDLEAYEGMLVTFPETLTITEQFNLDRFNEIRLAAGDRPAQFVDDNEPDAAGYLAHRQELGSRTIVYDDGVNVQNAPIGNLDGFDPYDTATAPRMGDTVANLTGVLDYQWAGNSASGATWRVRAIEDGANGFVSTGPRPATPADVGGSLKVASFNVLNYFTTLDDGSLIANGMEPRGANTADEFARQTEKLVNVLSGLDADILGLVEIENEFLAGASGNAIEYLVTQLNLVPGGDTYAYVNPGAQFVGGDAISVGFIYKSGAVQIAAATTVEILDDTDLPGLGLGDLLTQSTVGGVFTGVNTSRAPVAVTFEEVASGEQFTVVANHFKSKSGVGTGADADQLDGQGNWQQQRELAAEALTAWLATDPTGTADDDYMVIGDLNAYAREDTIDILTAAGFVNLQESMLSDPYSYVFDGQTGYLDYILANPSLASQITGVAEWHINADEADALDYNLDFGRDAAIFDADALARVSDHDPVIAGLNLGAQPMAYTLQLLHLADGEAGLLADETAPIMGAMIDFFDDTYANTLILAGGDDFLPGPFLNAGTDPSLNALIGSTAPGRPDIAIHNAFGVEASTIGNHEFDLGSGVFRDSFTPAGAWVGAQFPFLSSNLDFTADAALASRTTVGGQEASTIGGFIAPTAIVTEGGEKIGLIGATTQVLERISSPNGTEVKGFPTAGQAGDNEEVDDMVLLASQLQPLIDDMIAQGVNKIILMAHLQDINNEKLLATLLTGVDVILAAGSNTRLGDANDVAVAFPGHAADFADTYPLVVNDFEGNPTLIVNTDNEYTYLGRLVVEFDANGVIIPESLDDTINGAYASTQENLEALYGADIDQAFAEGSKGDMVKDITDAIGSIIAAKDGNVFGYTDVYLEGERSFVRTEETNLGDLSADANGWVAQEALGEEAFVVSLKNGGGIRAQIGSIDFVTGDKIPPIANPDAGKAAGGVSELDVENALRFDNKLMVFDTTPAGLLAILNHGAGLSPGNGGFPQIGGVRFSYDPDLPPGSRIQDVALIDENGQLLALIADNGVILPGAPETISVVTLNFTANGGDGYPVKANGENFRFLLNDGTLSGPTDEALNFTAPDVVPANAIGEQQAFEDFMAEFHGTPETAYDQADTPASEDTRIQNLNVREDGVFDDAFMGGAGGDGFKGTNGNDVAFGNGGNDDMDAGGGDDYLDGGDGNDEIEGDGGNDVIAAGAGNDEVWGGSGNDVVDGGAGSDEMYGEAGDDELHGGDGDDEMEGGSGNDRMHGDAGNDEMYGDNGNDELHGGAGNDEMDGDRGNDIVIGEAGNDRLAGGDGDDIFVFGPGSGRDVVEDFDLGSDLIDVRGYGFASADEVLALVETAGRNTAVIVLDDSAGDMVTLLGIRANQLHAEDFLVA